MSEIRRLTYRPAVRSDAAVETMTFARLRELNDGSTQRADFHVLGFVTSGTGEVVIDFSPAELTAGTVVWITPGAVHRWSRIRDVDGDLVLFVPTAPITDGTRRRVAAPAPGTCRLLDDLERPLVRAAWAMLHTLDRPGPSEPEIRSEPGEAPSELPQILLSALLAVLRPAGSAPPPRNPTFELFAGAVESQFRIHHDVGHYARRLGFSTRTLTRAAQRATGRTAKAYIVDRLALEAKRLLVHDRHTAARCAAELGFSDPSDFSAFFRKATGSTPGAWQRRMLAD